nr:hypothetical protein GCMLICPM_00111 [White spot syndrome virus]WRY71007.1 hypothetical protein OACAMADH_00108 [White spot syndrome virus]BDX28391.1 MAG: hypothetical protein [White spot syndrome virus]
MLIYVPVCDESRTDEKEDFNNDEEENILKEEEVSGGEKVVNIVVGSIKMMKPGSKIKTKYRLYSLLASAIGSRKKAEEYIERLYNSFSSMTLNEGGRLASAIYCPSYNNKRIKNNRSRPVKLIHASRELLSETTVREEILRKSPASSSSSSSTSSSTSSFSSIFLFVPSNCTSKTVCDFVKHIQYEEDINRLRYNIIHISEENYASRFSKINRLTTCIQGISKTIKIL